MNRLNSSGGGGGGGDPSAHPIPSQTTKEEKGRKKTQIYSKEFQAMLDSLDREECGVDELGPIKGGDKKRRLSSDQVRALEKNFEVENKLEPERKAKLAEELGLHPRQVAIWFQNRRARYKNKQLERDYSILRSNYDSLKLDYDNLEQEKVALAAELRELKRKLHQGNADDGYHYPPILPEESPVSDSTNNASPTENNFIQAGSEPSEEMKEDFPKEEQFFSSSSFYNPPSAPPMVGWIQFSAGSRSVKADEQQGFPGGDEPCNFFSVDQPPTLHWYFP